MNLFRLLGVCASALVLSACGGGGSSCKLSVGGLACKEYVANVPPVARAVASPQVITGSVVTLDGTGSSDANQDPLTYSWTWTTKPMGSVATLSSATAGQPTFTADVSGTYVLSLTVSDGTYQSLPAVVTVMASSNNIAPVARASAPSQVVTGALVTLDATGSTDANLDQLTFSWTWNSKPAGSAATLSSPTAAQPTFTADVSGTYVLSLIASDATLQSAPVVVTLTATSNNVAPVARAGDDQSVVVGTLVTLDGTNSTDGNPGDVISYSWSLSRPIGSTASLDSNAVSKPKFTADAPGTYLATLTVSDGKISSTPATVRVVASVLNAAPVANAGPSQSVVAGMQVTLDGTASSDANLDLITYKWTSIYKPPGSTATLDSATSVRPKFTADLAGTYVWGLVVNDGKVDSASSTVTIAVAPVNAAPVANAGASQSIVLVPVTGTLVNLDGSASSDANGNALTYKWSMVSKPKTSVAALSSATVAKPSFTADQVGTYVVVLVVNDGQLDSAVSATSITAALANVAPVANAGTAQAGTVGTLVTLSGANSTDANQGDVLTYRWALTTRPTSSTSTLTVNPSNSAIVTFTPDMAGSYIATLIVNDGEVDSAPATVLITVP